MKRKFSAAIAALIAVSMFLTGCKSGGDENPADTSVTTNISDMEQAMAEAEAYTSRPLEEGDSLAIDKINNKTQGDTLPGDYVLVDTSENPQGRMYRNGKAQAVIRAYNYKEDLQELEQYAESACVTMKIANITSACDTVFQAPEKTTVCGFDAIKYDYQIIQYDFIANPNEPDGETVKTELYRRNARAYFFYSEQDAYAVYFETMEEDWDEQVELFEKFVADLEVVPTEY